MPTGYTAHIVEGKESTFQEFANRCMRAFGATIHMRDEPMDREYEPRVPSDYHIKQIEKSEERIEELENSTNEELRNEELFRIQNSIQQSLDSIKDKQKVKSRLKDILKDIQKWKPPTDDHIKFKEFMISQIEDTLSFDTDIEYDVKSIKNNIERLNDLDTLDLKTELLEKEVEDLEYHRREHKEEFYRCKTSNEWVEDLLNSLDNYY